MAVKVTIRDKSDTWHGTTSETSPAPKVQRKAAPRTDVASDAKQVGTAILAVLAFCGAISFGMLFPEPVNVLMIVWGCGSVLAVFGSIAAKNHWL